jgi:hypothetical protein
VVIPSRQQFLLFIARGQHHYVVGDFNKWSAGFFLFFPRGLMVKWTQRAAGLPYDMLGLSHALGLHFSTPQTQLTNPRNLHYGYNA